MPEAFVKKTQLVVARPLPGPPAPAIGPKALSSEKRESGDLPGRSFAHFWRVRNGLPGVANVSDLGRKTLGLI